MRNDEGGRNVPIAAAAALVDALIVAISERLGADGAKNLQRIHRMKKKYRI